MWLIRPINILLFLMLFRVYTKSGIHPNFPALYNNFSRFLDAPYQTVILLYLKKDKEQKDMFSGPSITYYYIASSSGSPVLPQIRNLANEEERKKHQDEIYSEIKQSYRTIGKEAHRLSYTQTRFTFTTRSRNCIEECPLSDYVYNSIKESIEEILGKL